MSDEAADGYCTTMWRWVWMRLEETGPEFDTEEEAAADSHRHAWTAAQERSRIVAWLRREQAMAQHALDAELFSIIASAIEAGEHEEP